MKQGEVYLVSIKPTEGREVMGKGLNEARPCVVVSPDVINARMGTVMVAPMTSKRKNFPWRIPISFKGKKGEIITEQVRTYDQSSSRFIKKMGQLKAPEVEDCLRQLRRMFS